VSLPDCLREGVSSHFIKTWDKDFNNLEKKRDSVPKNQPIIKIQAIFPKIENFLEVFIDFSAFSLISNAKSSYHPSFPLG
jgi:hypothetical protein